MREIKFRAWDMDDNEMRSWEEIDFAKDIGDDYYMIGYKASPVSVKYDHEQILMQYTGIKDKNGVEIYEGDIVRWKKEFISPMDARTKHKIDGNRKVFQKESGEWVMGQGNGLHREVENIEVIGNIYENPHLLEGEDQ